MDNKGMDRDLIQKASQRIANPQEGDTVVDKFRHCVFQSKGVKGMKSIARKFRVMDDNGNRQLDEKEFLQGCKDWKLDRMSEPELKEVFAIFDKDNTGSLNFDEFLAAVRPAMNDARRALVKQVFDKMDKTGDGVIDINDMKGVYNARFHPKYKNGEWTEAEVFAEYLKNFEAQDSVDGKVTLDEWMDYYSGVSYSIDDDAYFSLMIRNCWKL